MLKLQRANLSVHILHTSFSGCDGNEREEQKPHLTVWVSVWLSSSLPPSLWGIWAVTTETEEKSARSSLVSHLPVTTVSYHANEAAAVSVLFWGEFCLQEVVCYDLCKKAHFLCLRKLIFISPTLSRLITLTFLLTWWLGSTNMITNHPECQFIQVADEDESLKTTNVNLTVVLDNKSGDRQSQSDSSFGDHECLYKISRQSIK